MDRADIEGILTLCATFRKILVDLQCCKKHLYGYDDADLDWLNDIIKKAEEML